MAIPIITQDRYSKSNLGSTAKLFDKKINYSSLPALNYSDNIVNFNIGENIFYGRSSQLHVPIDLPARAQERFITNFRKSADSNSPVSALHFIEKIFHEMTYVFEKSMASGQISSHEKYLSDLKVFRGFEDPSLKYDEYKRSYFEQLSVYLKEDFRQNKFRDMKQFLKHLTSFLKDPCSLVPFTYPSFIKSKYCDILSTGLAFEIADIDYDNDVDKVKHFVESPNWEFYVNACNNHAFRIDKHQPFRLVLDLNAEPIKKFIDRELIGGSSLLSTLYQPAVINYLNFIIYDFIELYNLSIDQHYQEVTFCKDGTPQYRFKETPTYDRSNIFQSISVDDILLFYFNTRLNEQKPNMKNSDRNKLINDCLSLYMNGGDLQSSWMIFEAIVSNTLDKIGSFEYYRKQIQMLINEPSISDSLTFEEENERPHSETTTGIQSGGGGY